MRTYQTPLLAEIAAGHSGPSIPSSTRAYFQERLRIRVFNFLLGKFLAAQQNGLTKAILARRIGKTPDVINRWLGAPSNLQLDTISDLLIGIAGEELEPESSSPFGRVPNNYSHFDDLCDAPFGSTNDAGAQMRSAERLSAERPQHDVNFGASDSAVSYPSANMI